MLPVLCVCVSFQEIYSDRQKFSDAVFEVSMVWIEFLPECALECAVSCLQVCYCTWQLKNINKKTLSALFRTCSPTGQIYIFQNDFFLLKTACEGLMCSLEQ